MLGKSLQAENATLLVLSVDCKVFEKRVNNRLVDHLEKYFLISRIILGPLEQFVDLLTIVSDIIARVFNRSGGTWDVALDFSGF